MPYFSYVAVGRDGKTFEGREYADSRAAFESRLKGRRQVLVKCRELRRRTVSTSLTTRLIAQLSRLVASGVVIERSLQIIGEDTDDATLAALADQLRGSIKRGQSLSQAFAEAGQFDPLLVPLVRAGEASGRLGEILASLQVYFDRKQKLRQEITASLAYPAILMFASLASLVGLGLYIVPIFRDLFADRMDELPAVTRLLFAVSDFLVAWGQYLAIGIVAAAAAASLAHRRSELVRRSLDRFALHLPLAGDFIAKVQAANITGTLGVLISNGVALALALELALATAKNSSIRGGLERTVSDVRKGKRLVAALDSVPKFPKLAKRLIAVGDETGELGPMSVRAAELLREDIQSRLKAAVSLLEPAIILFMGASVGFVVIAMLLAVYSLSAIG
ncbi:MAG: type II secretion system F family protein [Pseudomonadota bacterium]